MWVHIICNMDYLRTYAHKGSRLQKSLTTGKGLKSYEINPFMPNVFSPHYHWTSPFPILGLLGGICHCY